MSLLLCRREKVKHPFYIEVLGIHIYSSQEVCYVIYHHPLLVMNDFVDASLFFFVKNELGLGFLAGRMEKLVEAGGRPEEALYLFLSECDYYTEKEIQKFKQVTASYRNLAFFFLFGTNDEHVWNSCKTCFTDLVTHLFGTLVNRAADSVFF